MKRGKRVLYVVVTRAIYGMLVAALLWYKKFRKDLEGQGFEFNPYDVCVANRMVNGNQHTIRFHVDDLMSSHVDPKVNDEFYQWLNKMYGTMGDVTQHRGNKHDYLGVIYKFYPNHIELDMSAYVKKMLDEYPKKFPKGTKVSNPARGDLFEHKPT